MIASLFQRCFGAPPAVTAAAPGRVNLLGEHTDYNGGFVLPTPIPQTTEVGVSPRAGTEVRAASAAYPADGVVTYELGDERRGGGWLDYLMGVTQALARTAAGAALRGFDVYIASTVPPGGGLSSSAALEIALLRALRAAFALPLGDEDLARLGQEAEHEVVGARVGIMDQMVCSLGRAGAAMFLDTRSLAHRLLPLPPELELLVIHSGVHHRLAQTAGGRDYNTRRAECEEAARLLGVAMLRDAEALPQAELEAKLAALPEPLGRRARHVVSEDARVLQAVAVLDGAQQMDALGPLLNASHRSLREDFEVSTPEVDALVALAQAEPGVLGARLCGGGFGGAIVALARRGRAAAAGARIVARYRDEVGGAGAVLLPA